MTTPVRIVWPVLVVAVLGSLALGLGPGRAAATTPLARACGSKVTIQLAPGAFAEYMMTMDTSLYMKPKNLPFEAACLAEPLSGAWKGMIQYSQMALGEDVIVIGVGGIGLAGEDGQQPVTERAAG